jgi:hypothetical protein
MRVQEEDPPNRLKKQPHNPPIPFLDTWQDIPPFPAGCFVWEDLREPCKNRFIRSRFHPLKFLFGNLPGDTFSILSVLFFKNVKEFSMKSRYIRYIKREIELCQLG